MRIWTPFLATISLLTVIAAAPASAAIITYQQNAPDPFTALNYTGAEDVWLLTNNGGATDQNSGGDGRFIIGGIPGGGIRHGLMRFDLGTFEGKYGSIDSVTLRLRWHVGAGGPDTVQVFAVSAANADWVEGNSPTNTPAQSGESTWLYKNYSTTGWAGSQGASTPGVDYNATLLASNTYTGTEASGDNFDLTFTDPSIIESWLDGTNEGLFFRTLGENEQAQFRSSELAGFEPQLIIDYTAVPEPSSFALVAGLVGGAWWKRRRSVTRIASDG